MWCDVIMKRRQRGRNKRRKRRRKRRKKRRKRKTAYSIITTDIHKMK